MAQTVCAHRSVQQTCIGGQEQWDLRRTHSSADAGHDVATDQGLCPCRRLSHGGGRLPIHSYLDTVQERKEGDK